MIVPYVVGLYFLWRLKQKKTKQLIIFLLIITPIPGAMTSDPFHVQRTLSLLLPLTLVMAIGFDYFISQIKIKKWLFIVLILFGFSMFTLVRSYFVLLPRERSAIWGAGYPRLAEYIKEHPDTIFVIDQSPRTGPKDIAYIQLAFYLKIDPKIVQSDQDKKIAEDYYNLINYSFEHNFLNLEMRQIEWGESNYRDVIFVGDNVTLSDNEIRLHNLKREFEIFDPHGAVLFRGYRTSPTR